MSHETDSTPPIGRATGGVRFADGSVVIADFQATNLKYYDKNGNFLRTAGGRGGGPGEFAFLQQILRLGNSDTVVVWSPPSNYLLFNQRGDYVRQGRLDLVSHDQGETWGYMLLPDRSMVLITILENPRTRHRGFRRPGMMYFRIDATTKSKQLLLSSPGFEQFTAADGTPGVPFYGADTKIAMYDSIFYIGDSAGDTIHRFTITGRRMPPIVLRTQSRQPSKGELEIERKRYIEAAVHRKREQEAHRIIDELTRRATYPHFRSIVAGPGELWIQEYAPRSDGKRRWWVYSLEGRQVGQVIIPADFELWDVTREYIMGRQKDELDRDQILVYSLVRS